MKSFIIKLTVRPVALAIVAGLAFTFFVQQYYIPVLPFLLVFFYFITIAIHAYQMRLSKKDMGKFTRSTMLITFFKLVLYSVIAVVYIAFDKENAIPFVVCLMLLYLVFTFIETTESTKLARTSNK
jgi:phosphatidylglycerophosphate synthase